MKGKIDKYGSFFLERASGLKEILCPRGLNNCGDWCPLFSEPIHNSELKIVKLEICEKEFVFDERDFTDERQKSD